MKLDVADTFVTDDYPEAGTIREYLETYKTHTSQASSPLAAVGRRLVPPRMRDTAKLWATRLMKPVSTRKAGSLAAGGSPLRLHLGCGATAIEAWTNIDLFGTRADLSWDLRNELPFADESIHAIFHEHLLEHLSYDEAFTFAEECRRLLAPGGVIRIGVPDFGRYMQSYASDESYVAERRPGRPTALLALSELIYRHGHRSMWDAHTLCRLLTEVGFRQAQQRDPGVSALQPAPDTDHRKPDSLYVEAFG
jgi:predicted SAM-dependent methyltransferase